MNTPSLSPRETLSDDQLTMLKNWVAFYAKNDIYIDLNNPQLGNNLAAVPDTTQGEPPKIMVNAQLVMEKFNLSPSEFLVVLFHEIEHLFEDAELKSSLEGKSVIIERKQRQKAHGNLAGSYHFLENVLRDMFVNERVVSMDKVPVLRDNMHDLYQKKLFATKDYREKPLHQQFCNALLREHFVPEEECQVHPKVRKLLRRMVKS
ncbi:MAG: hypothetical protein LBP53_08090 [Candidatus Peribacteria bacterium]|jgi:hypothetical protein|nr:hypothetical protein [Candidatus Peribacteria bacterium]